jgi:hypothetical protein
MMRAAFTDRYMVVYVPFNAGAVAEAGANVIDSRNHLIVTERVQGSLSKSAARTSQAVSTRMWWVLGQTLLLVVS